MLLFLTKTASERAEGSRKSDKRGNFASVFTDTQVLIHETQP